jgi:anti-sigma-K factor RskA
VSADRPRVPELDELLGAYALDALDHEERSSVEAYIAERADARTEVDEMRETAAWLALASAERVTAPPELWNRIAARLDDAGAKPVAPAVADVIPITARRRDRSAGPSWRVLAPLAAAAAALIAVLGVAVVRDDEPDTSVAAMYAAAMEEPGTRKVMLDSESDRVAEIALRADGTGYLMATDALDPLRSDQTYQLWAIVGEGDAATPISAGVLGPEVDGATFHVDPERVEALALSIEPAGGSAAPTEAIARGTV